LSETLAANRQRPGSPIDDHTEWGPPILSQNPTISDGAMPKRRTSAPVGRDGDEVLARWFDAKTKSVLRGTSRRSVWPICAPSTFETKCKCGPPSVNGSSAAVTIAGPRSADGGATPAAELLPCSAPFSHSQA
jgi:hypothetical protein